MLVFGKAVNNQIWVFLVVCDSKVLTLRQGWVTSTWVRQMSWQSALCYRSSGQIHRHEEVQSVPKVCVCVWWTRGGLGQQLGIQLLMYELELNTPCCVYLKCSGNVNWHSVSFLFKFHWNCDPAFVLGVPYATIYLGKRAEKWWRGRRAGGRLTNMNKLHEFVQT